MKLTTTHPTAPTQIPQPIATTIDQTIELILYLTFLVTLSTNTLKSLTQLLTALKNLKKTYTPNRSKK
jgi:hypothetical protein